MRPAQTHSAPGAILAPQGRSFARRVRDSLLVAGGLAVFLAGASGRAATAPAAPAAPPPTLAPWVEPDFPFFSSVLDARKAPPGSGENNLTPRGLVLNLGQNCWACFDVDLLRVSAVWRGDGVAATALAPGSYHDDAHKPPGGQTNLARPLGELWLTNGIYPGGEAGESVSLSDPRTPAPSVEEVGRGPLPTSIGRFDAVRLRGDSAVLDYRLGSSRVLEWWTVSGDAAAPVIRRHFQVGAANAPLSLVVGIAADHTAVTLENAASAGAAATLKHDGNLWFVQVNARAEPVTFSVALARGGGSGATPRTATPAPSAMPKARWNAEVSTRARLSTAKDAYVVDPIDLPENNPWRRRVRASDIQFLPDGTAAVVTIDGDVWLARGLGTNDGALWWKRFASGFHEPMSLAIRDGQIFVFDRNGIWRLRDTDGNGEADVHELFSNAFAQTADLREFPSTLRLAPGGEFVIAKGGQQDTTLGKHNGSVLRISADGQTATVLGYGFRQPNIAVNLRTGLVTASDQQGQYIPSTPLHIVDGGQFYGFLASFQPREKYPAPIAEPLTWIPHPVNASALSQVWLFGAKMGPLNDGMVHIGFNRPELFRVLFNRRNARLEAAVVSITHAFPFPPLNGSVNPSDGQLYLAGFQVIGWGNVIDVASGLGRVRYTGAPVTLPSEIVPMQEGVLLRFDVALDRAKATNPASYVLQSWSYQRTYKYGSPQYKADGTPGLDTLIPSSAYLSPDGRSVFVGVPGMKPVMQLRVSWTLASAAGAECKGDGYTTPYALPKFDPVKEGFGAIAVDLTARAAPVEKDAVVSADEGRKLAQQFGCAACHSDLPGKDVAKPGPTWKGLYGSTRPVFINGIRETIVADEGYLHESILDPTAKVSAGYEKGEFAMPSFAGVLKEPQIQSLILYIKELR